MHMTSVYLIVIFYSVLALIYTYREQFSDTSNTYLLKADKSSMFISSAVM